MNEYIAKKIGEVLAFARVALDTIEKSRKSHEEVFGESRVGEISLSNKRHIEKIDDLILEAKMQDITIPKAEKTTEKLFGMRDHYIGDEWDNPAEIAEWLGFFEGAAIVHWKLVEGASEKLNLPDLKELSERCIATHQKIFEQNASFLKQHGSDKA